jgi:hypothetical protein
MGKGREIKLVPVGERLPDGYIVPLLYIYQNGNEGWAMGYHDGKEWEIEYSDDHPGSEDIKFWVDEV